MKNVHPVWVLTVILMSTSIAIESFDSDWNAISRSGALIVAVCIVWGGLDFSKVKLDQVLDEEHGTKKINERISSAQTQVDQKVEMVYAHSKIAAAGMLAQNAIAARFAPPLAVGTLVWGFGDLLKRLWE